MLNWKEKQKRPQIHWSYSLNKFNEDGWNKFAKYTNSFLQYSLNIFKEQLQWNRNIYHYIYITHMHIYDELLLVPIYLIQIEAIVEGVTAWNWTRNYVDGKQAIYHTATHAPRCIYTHMHTHNCYNNDRQNEYQFIPLLPMMQCLFPFILQCPKHILMVMSNSSCFHCIDYVQLHMLPVMISCAAS